MSLRSLVTSMLRSRLGVLLLVLAVFLSTTFAFINMAHAAGNLSVEIIAAYNLVVDSNVSSPSTYAPSVATVIGKYCNTGSDPLTDVQGYIGDYTGSGSGTPGIYPSRDSTTVSFGNQHPVLAGTGSYSFSHVGGRVGTRDATRYVGTLAAGECAVQYWHFEYPQCANLPDGTAVKPPCSTTPVWGDSVKPEDDLWLEFDIWGTGTDSAGGGTVTADATHRMTMRNEISAMANKIEPNPNGKWFNTNSTTIQPGDVITSNGVLYDLGNINQGFDNDGDYVYDYNAWMQPVGDPNYDPSCFRLIRTTGLVTVSRSSGKPDMIIPFQDKLYFTNLPQDNTGAIGNVRYTFLALDGPCSTRLTPYQEVASGADNEKFNADFGGGIPPVASSEPQVTLDKTGSVTATTGGTISYQIPFQNDGSGDAGLPLNSMPLVISDTIPAGLEYTDSSFTYGGAGITILYSTDNGVTWSDTAPADLTTVTTIQWHLDDALAAGGSGTATLTATVPTDYLTNGGSSFIENDACAQYGDGASFACDDTITVVQGNNSLGDTVWQDDDGDGVLDGGEPGIAAVTVTLYWDKNGDGELDSSDVQIGTTTTDGSGTYAFNDLPDGNYLVQVDHTDDDLPTGYGATTAKTYDAPLDPSGSSSAGVSDLTADFGFGPVLRLDKQLTSGSPSYEGEQVTYTIDLVNTRPGDGTGQANQCQYEVWSTSEASQSSTQPNNKRFSNSTSGFVAPTNAFGKYGPDDLFASADFSTGGNQIIAGTGYSLGQQQGNIVSVEARFRIYLDGPLTDDTGAGKLFFNGTQQGSTRSFTTAELNAFTPASNVGFLTWDVTALRAWNWSDFTGDLDLQYGNSKVSSADTPLIYMDAMGFRVTTDETCGGASDTIVTLPVTDTYDADTLTFVSAMPAESATSSDTTPYANTGSITWDDLGPLYAGQTKSITVTFTGKEPADTNSDGEPDAETITNTISSSGAIFSDGTPVHDATDSVTTTLAPAGTIGDLVWNDVDGDGAYEPDGADTTANTADDERGIAGVTVNLYLCSGACDGGGGDDTLYSTMTTDAGGAYLFEGLPDGTYEAVVDTSTLPDSGTATNTSDRDADTDSTSGGITIATDNGINDDDVTDADFGYTIPAFIEGSIWNDWNQSGTSTPDNGEEGLSGVTVYLDNGTCEYPPAGGGPPDCSTATTDANGDFIFTGVAAGSYTVRVDTATLPAGTWTQSYDDPNGLDGVPGTGDDTMNLDDAVPVTVVTGGSGNADFSYYETGATSVGDTLYADWNGNGTQEGGEEGIANLTVTLYEDDNGDGVIDAGTDAIIAATTTDSNGNYSFTNLPADTYIVVVDEDDPDLPAAYEQTQDPDEAGVCSACNARGSADTTGGNDDTVDFGYQPVGTGSIGDYVWNDADADGIQDSGESGIANITVTLYEDSNGDGTIDSGDAPVATTTTDSSGNYSFTALPAGDYIVNVDEADTDLPTDANSDPYVVSTGNDPLAVVLTNGQMYTDADFGFTAGGTIGDFIWQDNDGDGFQDTNEPGIANVAVELYDDVNHNGSFDAGTDTLYGSTTTDANGLYEFTGLPAADYVVVVDTGGTLSGFTPTYDPDDSGNCNDGDSIPCNSESGVTLSAGQINRTRDFGYRPQGVLGDTLWIDVDGDDARDTTESGLASVTVWLCTSSPCNASTATMTTMTDLDGYYSFGNLSDGTYYVAVDTGDTDFPVGLTNTFDADGTADNQANSISISGGSTNLDVDFGYQFNGSSDISGTVFFDETGDGGTFGESAGDQGYENVTVYLWGAGKTLLATTTTDSSGGYSFANLPNGEIYTVTVDAVALQLRDMTQTADPDLITDYRTTVTLSGDSTNNDFGFYASMDFGDLPETYNASPTTYTVRVKDEGPYHTIGDLYLGSTPDSEADGQPSSTATGDGGDEDGVTRDSNDLWTPGSTVHLNVSVTGSGGYLTGWFDWNGDGDFNDANEITRFGSIAGGSNTISLQVPNSGYSTGDIINTRFRLYDGQPVFVSPTGGATNGEVEDYQWDFGPTAITLTSAHTDTSGAGTGVSLVLIAGLMAAAGIVVFRSRRRGNA